MLKFIQNLPSETPFAEKLTSALANYDPDREYLAVQQTKGGVSVELYLDATG